MHSLSPVVVAEVAVGVPMDGLVEAVVPVVCAHSLMQCSPQVAHLLLQWAVAVYAGKTEAVTQKFSAPTVLLRFSVPPRQSVVAMAA